MKIEMELMKKKLVEEFQQQRDQEERSKQERKLRAFASLRV